MYKIKLDSDSFYINADTVRIGVEVLIDNHELGFKWQVIPNNRKNYKKVTNDENGNSIKYLYFMLIMKVNASFKRTIR